MSFLLLDIGGTNTRIGFSEDGETLKAQKTIPTNKDFPQAMDEIAQIGKELAQGQEIKIAGGGVKTLDKTKTHLKLNPFFPLWVEEPLKQTLEQKLNCPVFLENDTAIVGLGEAVYGAGKNHDIVVYQTISTGTNGIRVVNGHLEPNAMGIETGFQIIDADGSLMNKNTPVYLEEYIAGVGLKQRFGKNPEHIEDEKIWDEEARILAIGLNNTIVFWSPEIIILGGSLMKKISIDKVKNYLKEYLNIFPELPEIVINTLGEDGGLLGALALLRGNIK